ncbi:cell division protein FtsA [Candidatus Kaiserbacteria bacterium RIFOXYB1_FULL_46_14]|uniref:Cell division protein FtsA n=1 Tax=Candidatus Kaiserbacteria bacterium RIFOXYB1_FULL_46_14 TaxID=1798531 RepID=A0A1F6FIL9_9BACT|nr:MAG: cell division protein FtsA [Candidatus Kaiserbacteria bacterium RIFOXYB1_FULL_46_14]
MKERIIVGVDVGTYQVKVVVAKMQSDKAGAPLPIIGTGVAESRGLRNGYVVNAEDVARSVRSAIREAEKATGLPIKRCYLSTSSIGVDEIFSHGEIITSRADSEVTEGDVDKVMSDSAERIQEHIPNRKVLHEIPINFSLDGEPVLGRPVGFRGTKLEVDAMFVTVIEQHIGDLVNAVESTGLIVEDVTTSPLASSFVLLSKAQKRAGCVLANIGAETLSIAVFENSFPVSVKIFPVGGSDITNDIALGLKIPLEEAEKVKRGIGGSYSKRKLDELVNSRLSDMFELIDNHLKRIKRDGLLPAGIILAGGTANLTGIEEVAKHILRLPARVAALDPGQNGKVRDTSWAVAYGLCVWGASEKEEDSGIGIAKQAKNSILHWLSQFLP